MEDLVRQHEEQLKSVLEAKGKLKGAILRGDGKRGTHHPLLSPFSGGK